MATCVLYFFFFNDTATTEIYTLSLHDALPIWRTFADSLAGTEALATYRPLPFRGRDGGAAPEPADGVVWEQARMPGWRRVATADRKSTRLNSSHANISYAVFCLKKKKTTHSPL